MKYCLTLLLMPAIQVSFCFGQEELIRELEKKLNSVTTQEEKLKYTQFKDLIINSLSLPLTKQKEYPEQFFETGS